jgi:hypothetical protein
MSQKKINIIQEARAENIIGLVKLVNGKFKSSESYLELSLSNCELGNNHRWIWRIRTNLAQVAYINSWDDKAYNIGWITIENLLKTKDSIKTEIKQHKINSRRFAAIKAIIYLYYQLGKKEDIENIIDYFDIYELNTYYNDLKTYGNSNFDKNDFNLINNSYLILG